MKPLAQAGKNPAAATGSWATTRRHNGFTLIEVVMVMAIFSIGILALMTLHIGAISSNAKARSILLASTALADHFEKLISADDANAHLDPQATAAWAAQGCMVAQTVAGTPIANIKKIDLTVSWEGLPDRSIKVPYYKRNPGYF